MRRRCAPLRQGTLGAMEAWLPVALVTLVAAGTPGPNNLLLLRMATLDGPRAALPAAAGMLLGGWLLLALAWSGLVLAASRLPALREGLVLAGSAWLLATALRMLRAARAPVEAGDAAAPVPVGAAGMLLFQFANPKAWVFVLVLAAAARDLPGGMLFALYAAITTACSLAWILGGRLLAPALSKPRRRHRFDLLTAWLLALSALALPLTLLHVP